MDEQKEKQLTDSLIASLLAGEAMSTEAKVRPVAAESAPTTVDGTYAGLEKVLLDTFESSVIAKTLKVRRKFKSVNLLPMEEVTEHHFPRSVNFYPKGHVREGMWLAEGANASHWRDVPKGILADHLPLLTEIKNQVIEIKSRQDSHLARRMADFGIANIIQGDGV